MGQTELAQFSYSTLNVQISIPDSSDRMPDTDTTPKQVSLVITVWLASSKISFVHGEVAVLSSSCNYALREVCHLQSNRKVDFETSEDMYD